MAEVYAFRVLPVLSIFSSRTPGIMFTVKQVHLNSVQSVEKVAMSTVKRNAGITSCILKMPSCYVTVLL